MKSFKIIDHIRSHDRIGMERELCHYLDEYIDGRRDTDTHRRAGIPIPVFKVANISSNQHDRLAIINCMIPKRGRFWSNPSLFAGRAQYLDVHSIVDVLTGEHKQLARPLLFPDKCFGGVRYRPGQRAYAHQYCQYNAQAVAGLHFFFTIEHAIEMCERELKLQI